MRKIMVRAHALAKQMEGNYQARLTLALRMAWAEAKKEEEDPMQKRYEKYLEGWHLWDHEDSAPLTFSEWKDRKDEGAAKEAAGRAKGAKVRVFDEFVKEAEGADEDELRGIVSRMKGKLQDIRKELILDSRAKGNYDYTPYYAPYSYAFDIAREAILPKKKSQQPRRRTNPEVRANCGHMVRKSQLMSASTGTSCPQCYDRMSS